MNVGTTHLIPADEFRETLGLYNVDIVSDESSLSLLRVEFRDKADNSLRITGTPTFNSLGDITGIAFRDSNNILLRTYTLTTTITGGERKVELRES